jgi:hypothetical protein
MSQWRLNRHSPDDPGLERTVPLLRGLLKAEHCYSLRFPALLSEPELDDDIDAFVHRRMSREHMSAA